MLPLIIYVFSVSPGTGAVVFAVWSFLVSLSDGFLKPVFLGKGVNVPMLVILIGALGGMILHGMVGLFIGAVVMSIGYQLYSAWVRNWEFDEIENET
jgi:predicted PurR-regulated permease PerM